MDRIHIIVLGPVNSGKSTLVNALCGQEVSLVSPVPGTTTDPVRKAIELPELGPCVLIDTPGTDDVSLLGAERERLMKKALAEADLALVLGDVPLPDGIPSVRYAGEGIPELLKRIREALPQEEQRWLTGSLVKAGDCVLLVMPQDSEAPKGRIILPQVQVLRELLDRGCNALCCTPDSLPAALERLTPDLVITDSQVFGLVNAAIPASVPLTSFSILLAGLKGDLPTFIEGARAIDSLKPGDRILIAEACTHVPDTEDIGRVKIPALLQRRVAMHSLKPESDKSFSIPSGEKNFSSAEVGNALQITIAAGNDFPEDLSPYALIIHCGACVATASLVRSRIRKALLAGVPITNYGIALAKLQGILERVSLPY